MISDEIRSKIQTQSHAAEIRDLGVSQGMRLLSDSGNEKVAQGLTTEEEVERVTMRTEI